MLTRAALSSTENSVDALFRLITGPGGPQTFFQSKRPQKKRFLAFFLCEKFNRNDLICWIKGRDWTRPNPLGGRRGPASLLIQKLAARRAEAFAVRP
jgi:hypothetical protein